MYSSVSHIGYFRQTNCRKLDDAIAVQKRREWSSHRVALRKKENDAGKVKKLGCQHPYRGFIAREMAQTRREADLMATEEATAVFQDPRMEMTSAELRAELNSRTNTSMILNLLFRESGQDNF